MKPLSVQDIQLISAYLDNTCTPKEKAAFEQRLKNEPDLVQELNEFAYTRRILRSLPARKAPRDFTLSPAQVPAQPRRFLLAPVLNFASVLAVIVMAVIFVGTRLGPAAVSLSSTNKAAAPSTQSAEALGATSRSTAAAPMIIFWGQSGTSYNTTAKGGMGGGGNGALGASVPTAEAPAMMLGAPAPTSAPTPGATEAQLLMVQPGQDNSSSLILGIPDAAEQGKILSPQPLPTPQPASTTNYLLIEEIALGALAVGCALAAWIIRKNR